MDIFLTDLETGESMRFPMLPEEINVRTGGIFQSYTVLGTGDVKIPTGEELSGISWNGILPGKAHLGERFFNRLRERDREREREPNPVRDRGIPQYMRTWRDPLAIQVWWSVLRLHKRKLRLLATNTPINMDVYMDWYTVAYPHGVIKHINAT